MVKNTEARDDTAPTGAESVQIRMLTHNLETLQSQITVLHQELEARKNNYIDPDLVGVSKAFRVFCRALSRRLGMRLGS